MIIYVSAGCVNACNRHGSCVLLDGDYQCQCNEGWAGVDCSVRLEMECNDEVDNDHGKTAVHRMKLNCAGILNPISQC